MENPYTALADKYRIRLDSERVGSRPDRFMADRPMDHWKCVLKVPGTGPLSRFFRTSSFYYSKGHGDHGSRPTVVEVLETFHFDLCMDADSFEAFCSEFGFDSDSITHLGIYKSMRKQNEKIRRLLGPGAVKELLAIED